MLGSQRNVEGSASSPSLLVPSKSSLLGSKDKKKRAFRDKSGSKSSADMKKGDSFILPKDNSLSSSGALQIDPRKKSKKKKYALPDVLQSDGGRRSKKQWQSCVQKWNLPEDKAANLVAVLDGIGLYTPRKAHGTIYLFPEHIAFMSTHRRVSFCVRFAEVERLKIKKQRRTYLTFVTNSLEKYKLRGRISSNRIKLRNVLILIWSHFNGDTTIDIEKLKTDPEYWKDHPTLRKHISYDDDEDGADDLSKSDSLIDLGLGTAELPASHAEIPFLMMERKPVDDDFDADATLPISINDVWHLMFANGSKTNEEYQLSTGAFDLNYDVWREMEDCLMRSVKFSKPLESRFLSGDCHVTMSQFACRVNENVLYVCSESQMSGIPKGDCFTVKSWYKIQQVENGSQFQYWVWVDWHKSGGMLKGKIEKGTKDGTVSSFDNLMEYLLTKIPKKESDEDDEKDFIEVKDLKKATKKPKSGKKNGGLDTLHKLLLALLVVMTILCLFYGW
eukprot:CAMPEP_0174263088 /NCGR_PEP_ID=MMETSP0439-20130205/17106_1 /TAXON_ID=0 /ORGANISM="Stereomyxa ramosa, Strain Chinc5" /LENGTH=502 /DNA_ID=CAMNT_0015348233 /DNA_START=49 /DNA_END=1554 /DNA_ORIENTATION=+